MLTYLAVVRLLLINKFITLKTLYRYILPVVILVISVIIGKIKFGKIILIHTFLGKLLGWECFILPFAASQEKLTQAAVLIWVTFAFAAVEMVRIQLNAETGSADYISLRQVKKSQK